MDTGRLDRDERIVQARKLIFCDAAVSFVCGEEMRHHSFESKWEVTTKAREEIRKLIGLYALAAHAGVDFEMNGDGSDTEGAGGFFKKIELPLIPDDGSE